MSKVYMAIDQYGQTFHGLEYPRKDLLRKLGKQHAAKIYRDKKDGRSVHVGYIIGGLWLSIYEVTPVERPA